MGLIAIVSMQDSPIYIARRELEACMQIFGVSHLEAQYGAEFGNDTLVVTGACHLR